MGWAGRIGLLIICAAIGTSAQEGATGPEASAKSESAKKGDVAEGAVLGEPSEKDAEGKTATSDDTTTSSKSEDAAAETEGKSGKSGTAKDDGSAAKIAELTATVAKLNAQVATLESEKASEKVAQDERISSIAAAKTELSKVAEKAKSDLEKAKSDHGEVSKVAEKAKSDLEKAKADLKSQTAKAAADAAASNKKIADMTSEVEMKDSNIKSLQDQVANETKERQDLSATISSLNGKVGNLEEDILRLRNSLSRKTQEKDATELKLEETQLELDVMTVNYQDLVERYSDPSVKHFLTRKAIKAYKHPGIEGAANKTFTYVLPSLKAGHRQGIDLLNTAHTATEAHVVRLNAYVSQHVGNVLEPYLPFFTGFLVYGMIGCPFLCSMWCLTRVICRIKACLLFLHLYYALAALCAAVFAGVTGTDPFSAFAAHDASLYLAAQAGLCLSLVMYTVFLILVCGCSCVGYDCKLRAVQISGAVIVSVPYYELVWTPAMTDHLPKVMDLLVEMVGEDKATFIIPVPYGIAASIFTVLLFCEQMTLRHGKIKTEVGVSDGTSITMRTDGELRGVEELTSFIGKRGEVQMAKDE